MKIALIILMVTYLSVAAISSIMLNRKFKNKLITESERLSVYRQSIIETWVAAVVLVTAALVSGFGPDTDIGLTFHFLRFEVNLVFAIIVIVIACVFAAIMILQIFSLARNTETQISAWHKLSNGGGADAILPNASQNLLIPRTPYEKRAFTFVSLSAGICEEITMRGVLFIVLQDLLPGISLIFIPLIAGVLFGVAHSYQGFVGIIKTGLFGIGFGYLYLATGSLIPGIILHFLVDYSNRFLFPKSFM
jgi:membrane protease YdiL (CAAX protease family)